MKEHSPCVTGQFQNIGGEKSGRVGGNLQKGIEQSNAARSDLRRKITSARVPGRTHFKHIFEQRTQLVTTCTHDEPQKVCITSTWHGYRTNNETHARIDFNIHLRGLQQNEAYTTELTQKTTL